MTTATMPRTAIHTPQFVVADTTAVTFNRYCTLDGVTGNRGRLFEFIKTRLAARKIVLAHDYVLPMETWRAYLEMFDQADLRNTQADALS